MPPRRSQRQKRPSSQALEAIITTPVRRARRVGSAAPDGAVPGPSGDDTTGTGPSRSQVVVNAMDNMPQGSAANVVIPPELLEQLVACDTTEVTRQLQPSLQQSGLPPRGVQEDHPVAVPQQPTALPVLQPPPTSSQGCIEVPAVQEGVRSLHSSLAGEQGLFTGGDRPKEVFTSANLPVDARVSTKIKTKIWQEEFSDFGALLVNPTFDDKFQLTIQHSKEGLSPSLALEPMNRAKRITSIDTWLQAFHVIVGVYTGPYPHEAPGLMKYGAKIQDLAARGHNWRFYDENFRFLRLSQATSLPWGNIHGELWLRSQSTPRQLAPSNASPKSISTLNIPRGLLLQISQWW